MRDDPLKTLSNFDIIPVLHEQGGRDDEGSENGDGRLSGRGLVAPRRRRRKAKA